MDTLTTTGIAELDEIAPDALAAPHVLLIASRETSHAEALAARLAWSRTGTPRMVYTAGLHAPLARIALAEGHTPPRTLLDDPAELRGPDQIHAALRDVTAFRSLELAAFGHLDQFAAPGPDNLDDRVDEIGNALKRAAKRHNAPMVMTAPLEFESRQHTDVLTDLGEFYYLAYTADIVLFVEPMPEAGEIALRVTKNRNGPRLMATCAYDPQTCRFGDGAR